MNWTPQSWRRRPAQQQPTYDDPTALADAIATLEALPPLVAPGEINALRRHLARATRGEAFLLQGGDCAERFQDCAQSSIEAKLQILLQMSLVLTWGARIPVIRVARMAGQYAKPRSRDSELIDGVSMPSYRGDMVNGHTPTASIRRPDPARLTEAYYRAAATLNYARALLDAGFADLHHPQHWDLRFVRSHARRSEYEALVERILDALDFVESTGVQGREALRTVELYTSHEGLHLDWESALTRQVGADWYNLGAHFLWIGDRTRQLDGAHVDYARGIANPLGIKVGPSLGPSELVALLTALDPTHEPGRVTLITRLGPQAAEALPTLIEAVQRTPHQVVWSCDPMHGNTVSTATGVKTRNVDQILDELRVSFDTHDTFGTPLGGVHFELTGDNVTECLGGPEELSETDLSRSYETWCDPRLNYGQSLEMAFLIGQRLARRRTKLR